MSDDTGPHAVAVMYHYVRDVNGTAFPGLKALGPNTFRAQVRALQQRYEIVGLAAVLDFVGGRYRPRRALCLLTFDDGLRDHHRTVLPILDELGVEGVFFVITAAVDEHRVVETHKAQLLMASLGFEEYWRRLLACLRAHADVGLPAVDPAVAAGTYRWDSPPVAKFKYLVNFLMPAAARERALDECFRECLGADAEVARDLYMGWEGLRELQAAGMTVGGHSHAHRALATLGDEEAAADIRRCAELLGTHLGPSGLETFSYPFGKADSFTIATIGHVRAAGFRSAFATEPGVNGVGHDPFRLRRIDTKELGDA